MKKEKKKDLVRGYCHHPLVTSYVAVVALKISSSGMKISEKKRKEQGVKRNIPQCDNDNVVDRCLTSAKSAISMANAIRVNIAT